MKAPWSSLTHAQELYRKEESSTMADNAKDKDKSDDDKEKQTAGSPKHDISDTAMNLTDGQRDAEASKSASDSEPDSV